MNYIKQLVLIVTAFIYNPTIRCDEVITLFLKPFPSTTPQPTPKANTTKPAITVDGYWATYSGYLTVSDENGQIEFPRMHDASTLYLIITPKATPSIIVDNTIHHWEFEYGTHAKVYKITRNYDAYSGLFYWETTQDKIPKNKIIPRDSILIFSSPKNFYVPLGISTTKDKPNMVLPDIFVKSNRQKVRNTLYLLNIKQYFGPSKSLYKKNETGYSTLIDPHGE